MMSSANDEFCRLERPIDIYENERFWIGRGFSKAGLLPTERGPFSTQDASVGWKTLPAASLALLRETCPAASRRALRGRGAAGRFTRSGGSRRGEGTRTKKRTGVSKTSTNAVLATTVARAALASTVNSSLARGPRSWPPTGTAGSTSQIFRRFRC
jgi:hypothetical protein